MRDDELKAYMSAPTFAAAVTKMLETALGMSLPNASEIAARLTNEFVKCYDEGRAAGLAAGRAEMDLLHRTNIDLTKAATKQALEFAALQKRIDEAPCVELKLNADADGWELHFGTVPIFFDGVMCALVPVEETNSG